MLGFVLDIGRIVRYQAQQEADQPAVSAVYAAIVTRVIDLTAGRVCLTVFDPHGELFFVGDCKPGKIGQPGCWFPPPLSGDSGAGDPQPSNTTDNQKNR